MKTVKDIEYGHVETNWMSGECTEGYTAVNIEELKKEAIKELKQIRGFGCGKENGVLINGKKQICGDKTYSPRPLCKICKAKQEELDIGAELYILCKFNITEEDLK